METELSKPKKKDNLIRKMMRFQEPLERQVIAALLFTLLMLLSLRSVEKATAILVGMVLHELGHALVFKLGGIKCKILVIFPLGAVTAPINDEEEKRSDLLHWNIQSWLMQSGPAVNVMLMLISKAFIVYGNGGEIINGFLLAMLQMNGFLAIFNLLPFGSLDSGQLFHIVFSSLKERDDSLLSYLLTGISLAAFLFFAFFSGLSTDFREVLINLIESSKWVFFLLVFVTGVWIKQGKDDPEHANSEQAMSIPQVMIHVFLYAVLVVLTLGLF